MKFLLRAACGCHIGRRRNTNEDNLLFFDRYLPPDNKGLRSSVSVEYSLKNGAELAVFDGLGGERYGEVASYTAASGLRRFVRKQKGMFVSEREYILRAVTALDGAVVAEQMKRQTSHMGTTMVWLRFFGSSVYVSNVGDSRAYLLRAGEFLQLSKDHVEKRPGRKDNKPSLTQYLGLGAEDILLDPYITQNKIRQGDTYLLCSDGLTDMLDDQEIANVFRKERNVESCVQELIEHALNKGGRDNITVVVCEIV